ncbi:MAG: hypothetical protein HY062_17860 [Bacteroidetes bacterium]|nr:hypothetical protein [Bacteroidota bacterium]
MKYIYIIILLSIMVSTCFNSCKKKDNTVPDATTDKLVANSVGTFGNLQSGYVVLDYGNGITTIDSNVIANFYSSAANSSAPLSIYAGTVAVNNVFLKFDNSSNFYIDTTHSINIHRLNWAAIGTGTVSSFTYTNTPLYPNYSGTLSLH